MIAPEVTADWAVSANEVFFESIEKNAASKAGVQTDVQSTGIISDLFDKDILTHLEGIFTASEMGNNSLSSPDFKSLMSKYIPQSLVENIYRAIDVNDVGYVSYADFTNYLISAEAGTSLSSKTYMTRLVLFNQQEDNISIIHRDCIDSMVYVRKPCPMLISGGRDGKLSIWDPVELRLVRSIQHRDSNSVYKDDLYRSMDPLLRAKCKKRSSSKKKTDKVAITSMCPLFSSGLLCVGSADCSVTIYELGNQEVCGRFAGMDHVPTAIECFATRQNFYFDPDSAAQAVSAAVFDRDALVRFIAVGDSGGYVHLIRLHAEFELSTEVGMKKKNQVLFALSVKENCSKARVHSDWVAHMRFVSEVDSLVTASADGTICFLDISRNMAPSKVFRGHKDCSVGARCFSWSAFNKYIVSAGDRTLLVWDPFTLEVMTSVDSFRSPVVAAEVFDQCSKVFAVLSNKSIHTWHSVTFELLQVVADPTLNKPVDALSAMAFAPDLGTLFTAGNRIASWRLERSAEGMTRRDREDLVVALFNALFRQVVLVKSLGLVKVYQAETGEIVRQFKVIPLDARTGQPRPLQVDKDTGLHVPMISHACLDQHQTRLVVTAFDLSVQLWNINDGTNLMQMQPQLYSTTLAHVYANLSRSITCTSYEIVLAGTKKTPRKLVLIGTENGNVCGYHEANSLVDDVPVVFLRISDPAKDLTALYARSRGGDQPAETRSNLKGLVKALIGKGPVLPTTSITSSTDSAVEAGTVPKSIAGHPAPNDELLTHHSAHDAGHATKRSDYGGKSEKDRLSSTDDAVLWAKVVQGCSGPPALMVSYLSGLVTLWDLERHVRTHDLPLLETGPVLAGMRLKSSKSHAGSTPTAEAGAAESFVKSAAPVDTANSSTTDSGRAEHISTSSSFKPLKAAKIASALDRGADEQVRPVESAEPSTKKVHGGKRFSISFNHKARSVRKATLIALPPQVTPNEAAEAEAACAAANASAAVSEVEDSVPAVPHLEPVVPAVPSAADVERLSNVFDSSAKKHQMFPQMPSNRRDSAAVVVGSRQFGRLHSMSVPRRSVAMNPSAAYGLSQMAVEESRAQAFLQSDLPVQSLSLHSGDSSNLLPPRTLDCAQRTADHRGSHTSLNSGGSAATDSTRSTSKPHGIAGPLRSADDDDSAAPVHTRRQPVVPAGPKVVVDCVVVLTEAQVIIGACSDKFLRFWDLTTHRVLCSCCYYHRLNADPTAGWHCGDVRPSDGSPQCSDAPVDEVLRHLAASDSEDLLVGAYDNGVIRLWSVQSYSVITLRSLLTKHTNQETGADADQASTGISYGLAISPMTLLCEWTAHSSPIISIEYVWFDHSALAKGAEGGNGDETRPASKDGGASSRRSLESAGSVGGRRERRSDMGQGILEGYVMSAGVDQKVYLWSARDGRCVGEFGSFGWDVTDASTWYRRSLDGEEGDSPSGEAAGGKKTVRPRRPSAAPPSRARISASTVTRDSLEESLLDLSEASYVMRTIGRHAQHTPRELNAYVEELTRRVVNRPPAYTDVAKQFANIVKTHPIVRVKDGKPPAGKTHTCS